MNLIKRATVWLLALVMVLGMIPQTAFAEEKAASPLEYEIEQNVNEGKTEATISFKITETEKIQLEKVTLPDGTEKTEDLTVITYSVSENGKYDFKVDYFVDGAGQEQTIPVEVTELEGKKTEEKEQSASDELKSNKMKVNGNTYEVSTSDEFNNALEQIKNNQDTEATIILTADIGSNTKFVGATDKSITVKSTAGKKYTLSLGSNLEGDITIDNVKVSSGTLYCNGHRTIFTENCEFSIGCLYGGANQKNVDSVYVKINGKGVINSYSSEVVITGGCYKGSVDGNVYMEIDGDIDINATSGGHYISGGSKETRYGGDTYNGDPLYVKGDIDFILGLKNSSSAHNVSGTHNTHVYGDLNLTVKNGTYVGIDGQRENPERAIVDGSINMVVGDPNREEPVHVTYNWGIVGAGEKIPNAKELYHVGKDVNITTYENVWCWKPGEKPGSDIGGLTGVESALVEGDLNINVHGSHMKHILGIDTGMYYNDPTVKGDINIVANDAHLESPYTECFIYPTSDDTYLKGDANITMNGGRANQISAYDGSIDGKVTINITGNPTITHDVIGKSIDDTSPGDESVLNINKGDVTIPQGIWYFKTVNITNNADVTLGNTEKNAFRSGIYDVKVMDSSLTTNNTASSKGSITLNNSNLVANGSFKTASNLTALNKSSITTNNQLYTVGGLFLDNSSLTTNGKVYITGITDTKNSTINFKDYTVLGYGYRNDTKHDKDALISQNDTITFGPNTSLNTIYGNAAFDGGKLNIYSWLKIFGDYEGKNNALDLYAYSGDTNYPDATIKLEILGKTKGSTDVTLVKYGNVTEEGIPVVGQNYINALKVSEDTFKLANKNAKSNGLYFKKLADANTKDKADYDMWQVAQKDGYQVLYSFESGTSGKTLPNEVTSLLPKDSAKYFEGDTVTAIQPEKTEIVVSDGVWKFKGYDADSKVASDDNVNDEGHIQFTGTWEFELNTNVPDKPDDGGDKPKPDKPEQNKPEQNQQENAGKGTVKTADEANTMEYVLLMLVSALFIGILMQRRKVRS